MARNILTIAFMAGAAVLFVTVGGESAAWGASETALQVPQSTAFAVLGHSCGGIQEQAFATGFDATSGFPTGDVYLQTRCGGSGVGGGYHTTTYSAWVNVTWDFTGTVVSSAVGASAPANAYPPFSAFDSFGNEVQNVLNVVNGASCTVGNTSYCTYRAYLILASASTTTTIGSSTSTSTSRSTTTTTLFHTCGSAPVSGCQPAATQRAQLSLGNGKLSWKWTSSGAVVPSDFGHPLTTTQYLLCLYDSFGEKLSGGVPAGGTCGTQPCWKVLGTVGFKYADKAGTPDGLTKVVLKAGGAGHGKLQVQGGGTNLPLPMLPLTTPVRAQLLQSNSGTCWEATYSTATTNSATKFKAKSN